MSTAKTGTAMASDGVDFVNEDDAGRVLLALFEEIADAAGTDADKHFHEVGTGNGEEGDVGLTGDRAGEEGFAGSRRTDQQDTLGNPTSELLEFGGLAKEVNDFQ